ncbi:MAG: hypothetical protein ACJAYJ_003943 [Saprospiraceae bacterium]
MGWFWAQILSKQKKYEGSDVFANFDHEMASEWAEKKIFELKQIGELTEADFIRIYEKDYLV